jgi:uncharacterized protein YuzE
MKIIYDRETDTLTVIFTETPVAESDEDKPGVILDYDAAGNLVSLEILDASQRVTSPSRIEYQGGPGVWPAPSSGGGRRCLVRGLANRRGTWPRVGVPQNLRKLWRYPCAAHTVSSAAMAPDGPAMALGKMSYRLGPDHGHAPPPRLPRHGHSVRTDCLAQQGSTG